MDQYRQNRVHRLQSYIGREGLDAMLVTSKDAIFYLSRVFDRKCANKTKKAPMGALFFCQH